MSPLKLLSLVFAGYQKKKKGKVGSFGSGQRAVKMLLAPRRPRRRDTGWDLAVDMLVLAALDAEYNERVNQVRRTLSIATRVVLPTPFGVGSWTRNGGIPRVRGDRQLGTPSGIPGKSGSFLSLIGTSFQPSLFESR